MSAQSRTSAIGRAAHRLTLEGRAEAAGHIVSEIVEWFDMDDSSGHCRCTCGWRSRSIRVNWLGREATNHCRSALGKRGLGWDEV